MSSTIMSNCLLLWIGPNEIDIGHGFQQKESILLKEPNTYLTLHVQKDSEASYPDLIVSGEVTTNAPLAETKNTAVKRYFEFLMDLTVYATPVVKPKDSREVKNSVHVFERASYLSVGNEDRVFLESEIYNLFHPESQEDN